MLVKGAKGDVIAQCLSQSFVPSCFRFLIISIFQGQMVSIMGSVGSGKVGRRRYRLTHLPLGDVNEEDIS